MSEHTPLIALVGRPNVGKSTLFNRLVGQRKAVVSPTRGTTRDRIYGEIEWRGRRFELSDTAGMDLARSEGLAAIIQAQVAQAVKEADVIMLVCDALEGLVPADQMILDRLRVTGKPMVIAVNKADHRLVMPPEFFSLGASAIYPVSAIHGIGTGELLDEIVQQVLPKGPRRADAAPQPDAASHRASCSGEVRALRAPAVAIVGRQNVGKSSLFNALARQQRAIVSDRPCTTRDAVDTLLTINGQSVILVDTAGLRHRRKVRDLIDHVSMSRAMAAIRRCDVALLVLDATQGVTRDDQRILSFICEVGCGCVLLLNKWDLVPKGRPRLAEKTVHQSAPATAFAPVLPVSAKTGFQVPHGLSVALRIAEAIRRGGADVDWLAVFTRAWAAHTPPRFRGRPIRLHEARWMSGRPVRLELLMSPVGWLPVPYQHYLLKQLYAQPQLKGVPVQLLMRARGADRSVPRRRRR